MAASANNQATRAHEAVDPPRLEMSVEEFKRWYDREAGRRGEWVDGEVIVFLAPKTIHQQISAFLTVVLTMYVSERGLGQILPGPEMRLRGDRSYREPDLLFVATENLGRLDADGLQGPADLVVEIVSDDSARRDREQKFTEYEAAGVPEYWVIDPRPLRRTCDAYALTDAGRYEAIAPDERGRIHSNAIPGLWVDPAWLWSEPMQSVPAALKLIGSAE